MQIFQDLSDDLAISVLSESNSSLDRHFFMLPDAACALAVYARYPELSTKNSLEVDCSEHATCTTAAALRTFSALPLPSSLLLENLNLRPQGQHQQALVCDVARAMSSGVQEVELRDAVIHREILSTVLQHMSQSQSLTCLSLTAIHAVSGEQEGLEGSFATGLSRMHWLRQLKLCNLAFVDAAGDARRVAERIACLTSLTCLHLQNCAQNAGTISRLLPALTGMQCLDLHFHVHTAAESSALSSAISNLTLLTNLVLRGVTVPMKLKSFCHLFAEKMSRLVLSLIHI